MARMRLERAQLVGPMPQTKEKVVTKAAGMNVIDPSSDIVAQYKVRAANEVAEVWPEKQFSIFCPTSEVMSARFPNECSSPTLQRILLI